MNKKYTKQRLFSAVFFAGLIFYVYQSSYNILSVYLSDKYILLLYECIIGIIIFYNLYRTDMLPFIKRRYTYD